VTRAVLVLLAIGLLAGLGCGKHKYGQYELDSSLHKYCIEIRWGRILKAAEHVAPEMRVAFVESWQAKAGRINIQDLEVVSMAVAGSGDEAAVMLKVTYVDNATMQVESRVINQSWKRTEYGWFAYDAFDLDGQSKAATPTGEDGFGGG
jgi:hypothetical protein